MTPMLQQAASYEEVYRTFRWKLPERYNIAWDVCDRHARNASAIALIHDQGQAIRKYTFREIQVLANQLANTLVGLGLCRGDRVLIQLGQHPVTAFTHVACWKAGLVSVPTSVLFGADGLEYRMTNSGARVLITDQANLQKALEVKLRVPTLMQIFVIDGPGGDGVLPLFEVLGRASSEFTTLSLTPDTPAFINYTSGTTGLPKGTLQGHRSMLGHMPGAELLYDFFPKDGDLLWSPADWAWLAGLMDVLMPAWFHGKPVLTFPMVGFDPEKSLTMMGRHSVRNALLTPTVLKLLRPVKHRVATHKVQLRSIASGGEAVGKELIEEMSAVFGATFTEGFGQTECNLTLGNCPGLNHFRAGSLGVPLPGHVAGIVDDDGQPLPDGTAGNLAFKRPDPVMMLAYWNNPAATEKKYAGDWLLSGDLASRDEDGFFWFVGRADDVITSAGYRIGPVEIEDAIRRHPAVSIAAAIGIPDPERTEIIRAYVVLANGHEASEQLADEIRHSVRDRLARHEYPREIRFVPALPMTTTGKLMRRQLRQQARDEISQMRP
ncbi:AMP-binding protein [Nevskia ramosa]|uniref:AMP-binding protein n=1 Tax=Nevskia ramosa TaxID=64002 RepID=UPI003D0C7374